MSSAYGGLLNNLNQEAERRCSEVKVNTSIPIGHTGPIAKPCPFREFGYPTPGTRSLSNLQEKYRGEGCWRVRTPLEQRKLRSFPEARRRPSFVVKSGTGAATCFYRAHQYGTPGNQFSFSSSFGVFISQFHIARFKSYSKIPCQFSLRGKQNPTWVKRLSSS